jgi:1-aminocyclopropane-1-carboxylate deaminase/D-cysteine desulfhydrase-like pyridoxal-dependent ACC family enzyme
MSAVLVLSSNDPEPPIQGNLLLDRMLGAEVRIVPQGTDRAAVMEQIAADLSARGEQPYVIPVGGSNAIGAAGYLTMMLELQSQLAELDATPSRIYFGSGSGGTQAGIVLGARALGMTSNLHGILDSPFTDDDKARTLAIANQAAGLVGSDTRITELDMIFDDRYIGEAYGIPTGAGEEAIRLLARTQAIFLDSVYTGKAMSGLIDHIRSRAIDPSDTVVFIHTGGTPALFAAAERLARAAMTG